MTQVYQQQRTNMALGQLYTNQVLDPALLEVLMRTGRELFVPERLKGAAYVDEDLHIGHHRVLMEPLAFARMLQFAEIAPDHRVLDVGCNYGYSAAVLAQLSKHVTSIDSVVEFTQATEKNLKTCGISNVQVVPVQNLTSGYASNAPYDTIIINGAVEFIPEALAHQVAENGKIIAVQLFQPRPGLAFKTGKLVRYQKINGALFRQDSMDAAVPLLPEFALTKPFIF